MISRISRIRARRWLRGLGVLLLAATAGAQDHDPHAMRHDGGADGGQGLRHGSDAAGRPADMHHGDMHHGQMLVPRLVRFRVPPYGIVWGYPEPPSAHVTQALVDPDYRAELYHVVDCPPPSPDGRLPGLDVLITLMGHEGLKLYRSADASNEAGPDGIIAADDVVIIKINYQWPERGGTNVDLLRGLIRRLVEHPDGFTGEIVVCENTQFAATEGFDRTSNNAEDPALSPHDVVVAFQAEGHDVSHYSWTDLRFTQVGEYDEGDANDGYVVGPFDARFNGRVSYPKFRSLSGTWISVKHGVWDPDAGTYDRERLEFINVPVLKSHHAVYGVTACVKNYMGVVTGSLATGSHAAIAYGILGEVLAEIAPADLNILDCTWVSNSPFTGPSTPQSVSTRRDELVASVDPVAADIWSTTNILIPAFVANGFEPPWPFPSADPGDPDSAFRNYLDHSMSFLLLAGQSVTNDLERIDVATWSAGGDMDGDGIPDGPDNCPYDANADQADCDDDGHGDVCAIRDGTSRDVNGNGLPDGCECLADVDGSGAVGVDDLIELILTWGACPECPADLDQNGLVDVDDLVGLLAAWGPCAVPSVP